MRTTDRRKQKSKFKTIILEYIYHNIKGYMIATILLLIGVIAGVIFINHISDVQKTEIGTYINNFITSLKGNYEIDKGELLKNSLMRKL